MSKRILVVDDEPSIRQLLQVYFERHGCTVETAASGSEALVKLAQAVYDGVLLDFAMSGGTDGLAVLQYIRRRHPSLPVVVMTGEPPDEVVAPALAAGAQSCLLKPFGIPELDKAVEHYFRSAA